MLRRYWEREMEGLKLTSRGETVVGALSAIGTAAVLLSCIGSGWAFLALLVK